MKPGRIQKIIAAVFMAVFISCLAAAQDNSEFVNQTFSQEELAQMLAPVALYPDALLSQVLMAATYPFEVVEADRWMTKNPYLTGEALDEALQSKDWDVSVLSLCHYPKVLTMMSENLSWTARLGDAFANQEQEVMDTIQELRVRAREAGNLSTTNEQRVILEDRYIRIDPVNPGYIYVPAYDPYVVYGPWWYPMFPPFAVVLPGLVVSGPGVFFSPLFYVGVDVFGWTTFNWRQRNIVIVNIDRTRRFNRHFYDHKRWEQRPWRPDHDRRFIREKRAAEIPRFQPAIKPLPDGRRWDRKPGDGPVPDKRIIEPRALDRDKKPEPGLTRQKKRFKVPGPADTDKPADVVVPKTVSPDRPAPWRERGKDQIKIPDGPGDPRVIDSNRIRKPDRRLIEKDRPDIQPRVIDKSNLRPPDADKTVTVPAPVRRRDGRGSLPDAPSGGKTDGPPGITERTDRPDRGGMPRENHR